MFSYWEKQSFLRYDYIIVGSGIVGLSTAISLKEKDSTKSILVLERGLMPTGASSKNAGFACIGSLTELLDDLQHQTPKEVVNLLLLRKRGLDKLRQRLGDQNIGYKALGSYELISQASLHHLDRLHEINQLLQPVLGQTAFRLCDGKIKGFGFDTKQVKAIIENTCEGQLDTGEMLFSLLQYALQLGVMVVNGAMVTHFEEQGNGVAVRVNSNPLHPNKTVFHAQKLLLCTNAFTKTLLPDLQLSPGRGQVLITKPIAKLSFQGCFHFEEGYYYFRTINQRVLFGGGRNLDVEGETTTQLGKHPKILETLKQLLKAVILPHTPHEIDYTWSGIMAFGKDKTPIVQALSERVFIGVKMGGMGVAIGSEIGEQLANMV